MKILLKTALKGILSIGIAFAGMGYLVPAQANETITILHINDIHSRVLPVNKYGSTCSLKDAKADKCLGGLARLSGAIKARKKALEAEGKKVLVLVGGDAFQGSLFYTTFKGQAMAELLNDIPIDAFAVGNHEFDDGPQNLRRFIDKANFPIISANINATHDVFLKGDIPAVKLIDQKGDKIAIIGGTTQEAPQSSSPGDTIQFSNLEKTLPPLIAQLQKAGYHKIIFVNHIGVPRDKEIAARVSGIDVIVGGHTHTLLSNTIKSAQGPYPIVVKNPQGREVPIVQAGSYSRWLGEIELTFDDAGNVIAFKGDTVPLDKRFPVDADIERRIKQLDKPLKKIRDAIVGDTQTTIDSNRLNCRARECQMGDLVADAVLEETKAKYGTQIVLQNGGGLRASIDKGAITMGEVLTTLPFQNTVSVFKLKGADIKLALEHGVANVEKQVGAFPQVAGLHFTWDSSKKPGNRILKVEVQQKDGTYAPLDPNKIYAVASNSFMRNGGDGYVILRDKAIDTYDFGPGLDHSLELYIKKHAPLNVKLDGRITNISDTKK